MQLTGHLTRSVFERYNIVSEGDLLTAARMLDRFTSAARGFDTTLKTRHSTAATSTNASTKLQPARKTCA